MMDGVNEDECRYCFSFARLKLANKNEPKRKEKEFCSVFLQTFSSVWVTTHNHRMVITTPKCKINFSVV